MFNIVNSEPGNGHNEENPTTLNVLLGFFVQLVFLFTSGDFIFNHLLFSLSVSCNIEKFCLFHRERKVNIRGVT